MKIPRVPLVSATIAHASTWAIVLFLLLVPAYEGESVEATRPGEEPAEAVRTTETFLDANGLYGLFVVLTPVVLTGIAVLGQFVYREHVFRRMAAMWLPLIAVLALSFAAIFTIGVLYVPVAIALFVAALADLAHRPEEA